MISNIKLLTLVLQGLLARLAQRRIVELKNIWHLKLLIIHIMVFQSTCGH
jgi:hypothetical protein